MNTEVLMARSAEEAEREKLEELSVLRVREINRPVFILCLLLRSFKEEFKCPLCEVRGHSWYKYCY